MSLSRNQLNDYLSKINIEGKRVIDVGVQDKPTGRLTQGKWKEYITLDIDPQWRPNIVADMNIPMSEELKKLSIQIGGCVDVIFCIEVLEHCWDPVQVIENMANLLRYNGDLYLSAPFINPHHDKVDYLRYTNEWFRDVLPKFGFEIVEIVERQATEGKNLLQAFYNLEGLRVSKIRPEYKKYTYPIGYIVRARKVQKPSS